jgi:hypothetical protein
MQDPRYATGEPDYRAYVHRQYRRVYDDPSRKPALLRIGRPKTFADHIEPFDPARERRLRMGSGEGPEKSSGRPKKLSASSEQSSLNGTREAEQSAQRRTLESLQAATVRQSRDSEVSSASQSDFDIVPPSERAMFGLDWNARRHGPDPEDARLARLARLEREARLRRTGEAFDAMIASWRRDGSALGAEFLERYRDGIGGTRRIAWSELMTYPKFRREQGRLKGHYLDWIRGTLDDELWTPFLELEDGERIRVWTNGGGGLLKLTAKWNPVTIGSALNQNEGKDLDFARAVGQGEIEGFGDLTFTRRGNVIFVSGLVDMRFNEPFNFESGILVWIDSTFGTDAPSISNRDAEEYETSGPAREFLTTSRQLWQVTGRIVLREDRTPDTDETVLFWSDADREEAGP